ncbi:hypothetical protein MYX04_10305 [Nitrospiraceae bacterium AH_259_D15_M11_P09]|nr:hypothetical protein [Nitrospiraceae bacterium AH_259_D15_M11_P09]
MIEKRSRESFHDPKKTPLRVRADFEKIAQGNRVLHAGAKEIAEIERRLIAEIGKALAAPGKV